MKDVAEAMGLPTERKKDLKTSRLGGTESMELNRSTLGSERSLGKSMKLPNTSVNEAKLKIILKQLKKM